MSFPLIGLGIWAAGASEDSFLVRRVKLSAVVEGGFQAYQGLGPRV